jgi:hypothetical protein
MALTTHPPTPSTAEVKERVELYLYSPFCALVACARFNFNFIRYYIYEVDRIEGETSKMLHLEHSFLWCRNWTVWAVDQKHPEGFEMWCWRRMEKIIWTDHVTNEGLLIAKEQRNNLHEISKRKANWIRNTVFCVETSFYNRLLKER